MKKSHEWGSDPEFVGPLHHFREGLMMSEIKNNFNGGNILDAGMGGGSLLFSLAKLGGNCFGIDKSRLFVKYVKEKAKNEGFENIKVTSGELGKLPYKSGFFDMIVCGEVVEHINDVPAAKEFARTLKKGGVLVLTTPNGPEQWSVIDDWAGHKRRYTKESMHELLSKGFKITKFSYLGFPIIRIYQLLLFRTMVKSKLASEKKTKNSLIKTLMSRFLSFVFHFDKLFSWCKLGVGMVVVAKKR